MDAQTRAGLRTGARLALAHHPLCDYSSPDVVRVGRARVCSGCMAAAPIFLLALQSVRMLKIWRMCRACPWAARWDACPGSDEGQRRRTRLRARPRAERLRPPLARRLPRLPPCP